MIVRNVNDREVLETTYLAHGGAIAQMILDRRVLQEIGFLAIANLAKGKTIESHTDPMEEIYFVLSGEGEMSVDEEIRQACTPRRRHLDSRRVGSQPHEHFGTRSSHPGGRLFELVR